MKTNLLKRMMCSIVSIAILLGCVPAVAFPTIALGNTGSYANRTADASTMDDYLNYFTTAANGTFSTENAGGVWTDKSVFTDNPFTAYGIKKDAESFLVALSAIASNMTITGQSSTQTDTIFVLDVSGSMQSAGVADDLAVAVNASMKALLAQPGNRVGIVLYSGSSTSNSNSTASVTLLPLGSYTTGSDGNYVNYSNNTISLDRDVVYTGTNTRPSTTNKEVTGATYIQKGIIAASNMFNSATLTEGENRKPVMVLLSDGAPTLASSDYTDPGQFNMGMGNNSTAGMAFVTQLSASYAKSKASAKYGTECLLYTLGLGTSGDLIATNVLNPSLTATGTDTNSVAIKDFWDRFDLLTGTERLQVQSAGSGYNGSRRFTWSNEYVTKPDLALSRNYVNRYFDSTLYEGNAGQALAQAFTEIVREIELQSAYSPTLVSGSSHTSGYISFMDYIGEYMNVTDIKGMVFGEQYFSGAEMAKGVMNGIFGTVANPTEIGDNFVWSLEERLGITVEKARSLIDLAYSNGQLYWNSDTDYSNYIGWYADADNNFLGFWQEGMEITDPNAVYIMNSYCYLGEINHYSKSDMMYTSVRLRRNIQTGEQAVIFLIPAALVPIITYDVALDAQGDITELTATEGVEPIRLIYEVALDPAINAFTVSEIADPAYISANSENGTVKFYTNQFESNGSVGYGKKNTYTYFRPSLENNRYYYQSDSVIYTDAAGRAPYTGTSAPTGTVYHTFTYYENANGKLSERTDIHIIPEQTLADATRGADGTWYIPEGSVRRQFSQQPIAKVDSATGTLDFYAYPYAESINGEYMIGVTLGNNGLYTLQSETGIKISKELAPGTPATTKEFTFTVKNISNESDAELPAYKVKADGTVDASLTSITFTKGVATIKLLAGESVYIGGMSAGDVVITAENADIDYKVVSVNGNSSQTSADLSIAENTMQPAVFVNAERGNGNLTISKEVTHPFGDSYTIPEKQFNITVNLSLEGVPLANYDISNGITGVTDENGSFTFTLKHNEQIEFKNLPEGTLATVIETLGAQDASNFNISYYDNSVAGDGIVTISAGITSSVIIRNDYTDTPKEVHPINISVNGTKEYNNWTDSDTFYFRFLELIDPVNTVWTAIGEDVKATKADPTFDFGETLSTMSYTKAGVYYYRVIEILPDTPVEGITYDSTIHSFAVTVTDNDMDGNLEISSVTPTRTNTVVTGDPENGYTVTANFKNVFSKEEADATVEIIKKVVDIKGDPHATATPNGFTFEVFKYDPVTKTFGEKIADIPATSLSGIARINLSYKEADDLGKTYTYAVKEVNDGVFGWTYVSEPVIFTVEITKTETGYLLATAYEGTEPVANATSSVSLTFTNTYNYVPEPATVTVDFVNKALTGRDLVAGEFNFKLFGADSTAGTKYGVTLNGTNDAAGNVIFDGVLTFDEVGTYFYDIIEVIPEIPAYGITYDKNVFHLTIKVTDDGLGHLIATPTLVNIGGTAINVTFNNTFVDNPDPAKITVTANKTLEGLTLLNDAFSFVMKEADAEGNVLSGGQVYTAKNLIDGTVKFPEITYNTVGNYYYLVSEAKGTVPGIIYDAKEYLVTVKVTRTENTLYASASYELSGTSVTEIKFENKYIPAGTSVQLSGTKSYFGAELKDSLFSFTLTQSDASWTKGKEIETVSNIGTVFTFAALDLSSAGTYYYLVTEVNNNLGGVTYDPTVYRIKVVVTDNLRGQLNAVVSITDGANVPSADISFSNIYEAKETSIKIEGNKVLDGRDLIAGEFTFEIFENDALLQAVKNLADGTFAFDAINISKAGTYIYTVKESSANALPGVTYDTAVYTVTVTVEDNGLGQLIVASTVIEKNGTAAESIAFNNKYDAESASVIIGGNKVLEGRDLVSGEFKFLMFKADAEFNYDPASFFEAVNAANGSFTFESLVFNTPGTYYYVIIEDASAALDRVTYDTAKFFITVAVKDDTLTGKLIAEYTVATASGTADAILFKNVYTPKPENNILTVDITKKVEIVGAEIITPEGFTFILKNAETGETIATVVSDAAGLAEIILEYAESDIGKTYTYILSEVNDGRENVTYSTAEYTITVTVALSDDGKIVTSTTVNGTETAEPSAEFINFYVTKATETGDNMIIWLSVLFISGLILGTQLFSKRRRTADDE